MSYAMSRPAMSPAGVYYEVAASPRGDLLLYESETGPGTWLSGNVGAMGILSFFLNLLVYKRRWRVVVRQSSGDRSESPTSGVLLRREVPKKAVDSTMQELAAAIESGSLNPNAPATWTTTPTQPASGS